MSQKTAPRTKRAAKSPPTTDTAKKAKKDVTPPADLIEDMEVDEPTTEVPKMATKKAKKAVPPAVVKNGNDDTAAKIPVTNGKTKRAKKEVAAVVNDANDNEVATTKKAKKTKNEESSAVVNGNNNNEGEVAPEAVTAAPKRGRPKKEVGPSASAVASTSSLLTVEQVEPANLFMFGENDCGQLGLNDINDRNERRRYPALVPDLENQKFIAVACGGMHTVALEENGTVWSFGCNDDNALGRDTPEEEDTWSPGKVNVPGKVVQISAGDSHSAALTDDGKVYAWGTFKDDNGNFGLVVNAGSEGRKAPELITNQIGVKIQKISSGNHHIVMLGEDGFIYTCGTGSQGQLGRLAVTEVNETVRFTRSKLEGNRPSKKETLLQPALVKIGKNLKFSNIWTGEFSTYCQSEKGKDTYVFGLNNMGQLGIKVKKAAEKNVIYKPTKTTTFKGKEWKQIAAGQHHTIALDTEGKVYAIGRNTDGRLGLGDSTNEDFYETPQLVRELEGKTCVYVAVGTSTSYAITSEGHLYSWGFGSNYQLATGDDEDRNVPTRCRGKKGGEGIDGKVVRVQAGAQHAAVTIIRPPLVNGAKD